MPLPTKMSRFKRPQPTTAVGTKQLAVAVKQARESGQLNLSNRELTEIPDEVWDMYRKPDDAECDFNVKQDEQWWNVVELKKLILASNSITSISEKLVNFLYLVILDLHDNKVKELPDVLGDLEKLERLDLSHNELQCLPESFRKLSQLDTLLLHYNQLKVVPSDLSSLKRLKVLDMSHNQLSEMPRSFGSLTNLQSLNMSHNSLKTLPSDVANLSILSSLDLCSNNLSQIPDLSGLSSLKILHLRQNKLESIPVLKGCVSLKELYCASNRLSELPITHLPTSIVILEVRDNSIKVIDENLVSLTELERLDIANNNISGLPARMGLMEHLKVINVLGNPMRGIRRDVINQGTQSIKKYLATRVVETGSDKVEVNDTDVLGSSLGKNESSIKHELAKTKTLDFSKKPWNSDFENRLDEYSDIPLGNIAFTQMGLAHFPMQLCLFKKSLTHLTLARNKLTQVPPDIGQLTQLTHLDLSSNGLSSLPSEAFSLKLLIEINLSHNRFTTVPTCLFEMEALEHLLISSNKLIEIPSNDLQRLPRIATLALENNNISKVPPEICLLPNLSSLKLDGNTFRQPRQSILQQGTTAILDYLRNQIACS